MLNFAPLDYERYMALYGPYLSPATTHVAVKSPPRSAEAVSSVSADISRRHPNSMHGKVERLVSTPAEKRNAALDRNSGHSTNDRQASDMSWPAESAYVDGGSGDGSSGPSPRRVAELYETRSEAPKGIILRMSA